MYIFFELKKYSTALNSIKLLRKYNGVTIIASFVSQVNKANCSSKISNYCNYIILSCECHWLLSSLTFLNSFYLGELLWHSYKIVKDESGYRGPRHTKDNFRHHIHECNQWSRKHPSTDFECILWALFCKIQDVSCATKAAWSSDTTEKNLRHYIRFHRSQNASSYYFGSVFHNLKMLYKQIVLIIRFSEERDNVLVNFVNYFHKKSI